MLLLSIVYGKKYKNVLSSLYQNPQMSYRRNLIIDPYKYMFLPSTVNFYSKIKPIPSQCFKKCIFFPHAEF